MLGFLGGDMGDDARCMGFYRYKIASDKSIIGPYPETSVVPPVTGITQCSCRQYQGKQCKTVVTAGADRFWANFGFWANFIRRSAHVILVCCMTHFLNGDAAPQSFDQIHHCYELISFQGL